MTKAELLIPEVAKMSPAERTEARQRVAMESPAHLKAWLEASGRRYLVMDALELVDSLPWPGGVEALMQIIACYRDHRATIPTGRTEKMIDPATKRELEIPIFKGEVLEVEELPQVLAYLTNQLKEWH